MCTNRRLQVIAATECCVVARDICESCVWNVLHVNLLARGICESCVWNVLHVNLLARRIFR